MKRTKHIALFALLLILCAAFAACNEDISESAETTGNPEYIEEFSYVYETPLSLEEFDYNEEIDTEHVLTERELEVINSIWRVSFGKNLAETPEEVMARQEKGNFYFGRYGRTFVFYRYSYSWDMEFSWGGYDFVFPRGSLFFVTADRVYDQSEITNSSVFTDGQLEAFYNYYKNTYLNYKPTSTLPEGEHALTQHELDAMNLAYARQNGFKDAYKVFDTLEIAMQRKKDYAYYFGRFGDTVIIWSQKYYSENKSFTLGGYDFEFYSGSVLFFDPAGIHDNDSVNAANIMTASEIKAFYDHYTEYYLPFNSDPYVCIEFTDGVEKLTEDEMRSINSVYDEWKYEQKYNWYYDMYIDAKYSEQKAHESAVSAAHSMIGYDPHRFFNEDNAEEYQYYGKRGNKVFLASENTYDVLTVIEVAGYKFVLDGSGCDLLVCENGVIKPLDEAYEKGIVSSDDVEFVHKRHLAYVEFAHGGRQEIAPPAKLKIGSSSLPDEITREIVWEYIADSTRLEEDLKYTYGVRCFGTFDGAYAVMIDGPWGYTEAMRSESVAGYTFIFNNGQRMYIYKQGVFYTLLKAYELGVISEKDVEAISWPKTAPFTYETTTAPIAIDEEKASYLIRSYAIEEGSHKKGAVYSMRCYGKAKWGYAVFIDCSDKTYEKTRTVETVCGYEFIYPTEQKMVFCYNWGGTSSFADAIDHDWLEESELKAIWETYRTAHTELYN